MQGNPAFRKAESIVLHDVVETNLHLNRARGYCSGIHAAGPFMTALFFIQTQVFTK